MESFWTSNDDIFYWPRFELSKLVRCINPFVIILRNKHVKVLMQKIRVDVPEFKGSLGYIDLSGREVKTFISYN